MSKMEIVVPLTGKEKEEVVNELSSMFFSFDPTKGLIRFDEIGSFEAVRLDGDVALFFSEKKGTLDWMNEGRVLNAHGDRIMDGINNALSYVCLQNIRDDIRYYLGKTLESTGEKMIALENREGVVTVKMGSDCTWKLHDVVETEYGLMTVVDVDKVPSFDTFIEVVEATFYKIDVSEYTPFILLDDSVEDDPPAVYYSSDSE